MKLIATVTIYPGPVAPGEEFDVKDRAEAASLIERGFATPVPAKRPAAESAPAAGSGAEPAQGAKSEPAAGAGAEPAPGAE